MKINNFINSNWQCVIFLSHIYELWLRARSLKTFAWKLFLNIRWIQENWNKSYNMRINYHHTIRTIQFFVSLFNFVSSRVRYDIVWIINIWDCNILYKLMQLTLFETIYGKSLRAHLRVIYLRMHPTFV